MTSTATTTQLKKIRFRIKRQDTKDSHPYWEQFDVPYKTNMNVISSLQSIAANPVTTEGKQSTPVVWDCNCLEEVCGACTMLVNGHVRQSCSTLIDELIEDGFGGDGNPVVLEPMTKFPVVRDLWVDRSRMFEALKTVRGWVPIDGTHALGAGPREDPERQAVRYALSRCMTCGCCLEACPQYQLEPEESEWDRAFIGPQAISQVRYFNDHPTGKVLADERLNVMEGPGGITDCGNAQNCVKVCPKEIPLTESIGAVGRSTTIHAIKKFFSGK